MVSPFCGLRGDPFLQSSHLVLRSDYRVLTPLLAPLSPHVEHARLSVHLAQFSVGYWCDTHHRCPFLIYCSLLSCPAQASARDASNYCYELYPFSLSFIFLWEPFVTFPP